MRGKGPQIVTLLSHICSILPPNSVYAAFTLDNCITTGGYYLSVHNMTNMLFGMIHSFILDSLIKDPDTLCPALYVRRVIQYLHTNLVVNDRKEIGND